MSEKPLLYWLERRKESTVISKARDHVNKIVDAAVDVDRAFGLLLAGKRDEVAEAMRRVEMDEKAADNIEASIIDELSRGGIDLKEREDLMRLVRRIDDIADWFKVASRNLELILDTGEEVPDAMWSSFKEMTKNSVDCCRSLRMMIEALGHNKDEVVRARGEVDRYEHLVDELYFGVKKMMMKELKDTRAVVVMNDMLVGIENATDSCKAAADSMYILAMAGQVH